MLPMTRWFVRLLIVGGAAALLPSGSAAQQWPRFRGPNGSGESETILPAKWSDADYVWKIELPGSGHSSPVLWGNQLWVTSALSHQQRLLISIDARNGKVLWQREFTCTGHPIHKQNSFASSSPTVDADHVYVAWATPEAYRVYALGHDGRAVWEADLGPYESQHGFGASPIIYKELLILNSDQDGDSALWALDRKTGERRWRLPRRTAVAAYSTPCIYRAEDGAEQLIFNSQAHGITGVDPQSGETLWELDLFDKRSVSSPIVAGGLVFGSCGSGAGGNYLVAVRPGVAPQLVYKVDRSAPYVPTSVARGNLLFLWADNSVVTCIRADTGSPVWQQRVGGNFSSSPVRAADKIYCVSAEGEAVVLAAEATFQELGRVSLGEVCRSTPAISGGQMFLRTESHLMALGGKQ